MKQYTRREWGARAPKGNYQWYSGPTDEGVVHYSASEITEDPPNAPEVPKPKKPGPKWYQLWRRPTTPKAQRRRISRVIRRYNEEMRHWRRMTDGVNSVLDPALVKKEMQIVRSFQNYHMDGHGWNDIGYHFIIFASGNVYNGRPVGTYGAHALGANDTIGFCFVMGPGDFPTEDMIDAFHELRRAHGVTRYRGHRQVPGNSTACPGDELIHRLKLPVGY